LATHRSNTQSCDSSMFVKSNFGLDAPRLFMMRGVAAALGCAGRRGHIFQDRAARRDAWAAQVPIRPC